MILANKESLPLLAKILNFAFSKRNQWNSYSAMKESFIKIYFTPYFNPFAADFGFSLRIQELYTSSIKIDTFQE